MSTTHDSEDPTDFELELWEKDARRLIVCHWCGGSGHWFTRKHRNEEGDWQECPKCSGAGKSEADTTVRRLVAYIRKLKRSDPSQE